jgi:ubiquinone/menaquinone biosynthesis C-methylase UbiE
MNIDRRSFIPWLASPLWADDPIPAATTLRSSFWGPVDEQLIDWLALRPGQAILDAGCGQGDHLLLIARRLRGPGAVGLDKNEEALRIARLRASAAGLTKSIRLLPGDIYNPPFSPASFDLVWSSHVLHGVPDIDRAISQLASVLKPGGRLVIRENRVPQTLLPRDTGSVPPGLEARLQAAFERWFLADRLQRGRYPAGWLAALEKAGLANPQAKSFMYERNAPFSSLEQQYFTGWLRRYANYEGVDAADAAYVTRLLDPTQPEWLFARRDLHFISVSTVYFARKGH